MLRRMGQGRLLSSMSPWSTMNARMLEAKGFRYWLGR
jgi:hypothetical protein